MSSAIDSTELDRHLRVRVVANGGELAEPIFQRRYRQAAPDFPHHVLAFHVQANGDEVPICYIHFTELGSSLLGGGACVDDRVLRRMDPEVRAAIRKAGGLYRYTLAWAVAHFSSSCQAVFGFCGDALAERVDLSVGFRKTAHPNLLVYFTRPLAHGEQDRLIAAAHAVGPF